VIFQQLVPVDYVRRPEGWNFARLLVITPQTTIVNDQIDLSTLQFGGKLCRLKDVAITKLDIM